MNWEAIGAIGEILGAIAVLVTLVYLALQIRQNTYQIREAASQDTIHLWNTISQATVSDPNLVEIFLKGQNDLSALNPVERKRYTEYCLMVIRAAWAQDRRVQAGALEFDDLTVVGWLDDWIQANPGFSEIWNETKNHFPVEFQQRVTKAMNKNIQHSANET